MASGRVYRSDPFRPVLPNVGQYGVNLDSNSSESDTNSEAGKKPSSSSSSSSDEAMDTLTPYPPRHQPKGGVRKKSEEEYVPTQSGEEEEAVQEGKDSSASESSSPSSDSGGSLQRQVSRPRIQRRTQVLDEEEDEEDSTLTTWPRHTRVREGFGDFQPCPPRRRAARTLNYSKFYQSEEESSEEGRPKVVRRGRRRRRSDSEFEVSISEQSESEPSSADEGDTSEEEYLPRGGQRTRGTGRGKGWDSGSDSDYLPSGGPRKGRKGRKKGARKRSDWYEHTFAAVSEPSSSGSEFEPGGGGRRRRKKGGQGSSDFVRMTSRRKGAVSYKESSSEMVESDELVEVAGWEGPLEEDNREAIEKVQQKRVGRVGDTGSKTTVYAQEPQEPLGVGEDSQVQYLIKWVNWSHLHNTWETESTLLAQNVKGMKKFYNWLKREEERELWEKQASPEDVEYFKCQEELKDQLLEQYMTIERVIAARNSVEGLQEYLCKWRGLPYSECTWEDGKLISEQFQDQIDSHLDRNNSDCIPMRNAKVLRHRPKFSIMKEQLPGLGGVAGVQLRRYQLDGVNWLVHSWCKSNSVILADEMGLGKTIQTIAFLHCLYHEHALYGPYLVVVPLSTMSAWQREFELWACEINTVMYLGDISSRDVIREYEWAHPNRRLKFNVILTTYEILLKDKDFLGSVSWAILVVDEAHRLKNDDSLLYRTLMGFRTNHRLLITGTPLQNSLKELWSLLHFIMEKEFPVWEEFESKHHAYGEGDTGSLSSLHQQLQPFLLRRVKKDVEKSLPAKVEQILRVEMSSVQKQYYRWILSKNYKALSKGVKGSITGFINIVMELKKCCNHTWIVRDPEEREGDRLTALVQGSGKLFLLDKLLLRLRETGHRVLIFSQMVRMLDILAEYMQLRHFPYQRLDGSIGSDQRKDAIDHFNAQGSQDFCFLLSTRAGGLGVNLATADTVVIFDSDWNPQNDLQAQARAHRIGQTKQVNIYRLVTHSSIEEEIVERAKRKMVLDHLVIQKMDTTGRTVLSQSAEPSRSAPFDKEELNAILKFGAEELFREGDKDGDQELREMDIDDILRRAEMQAAHEESSVANELLSQFNVASFALDEEGMGEEPAPTPTEGRTLLFPTAAAPSDGSVQRSWDEIIPQAQREKMEEEERTKEQLQLYLPPRQRTVQNYYEDSPEKSGRGRHTGRTKREGIVAVQRQRGEEAEDTDLVKNLRGFTDYEIRRFVKSYRKFSNPRSRLDAIAADAELQEKSVSEMERLLDALHEGCVEADARHKMQAESEGRVRGAVLRLSGVTINASSILKREKELEALEVCIPAGQEARKRYRMVTRTKTVTWAGVRWTAVDDARLLVGVNEYGVGNWDSIRSDSTLGLTKKILPPNKAMKPQASHLQTRVDYLLRLLQEEARLKQKAKKNQKVQNADTSKPPRRKLGGGRTQKITNYFQDEKPSKDRTLTVNIPREILVGVAEREGGRKRPARSYGSPAAKKAKTSSRGKKAVRSSGRGAEESTMIADTGGTELGESTFKKCKSLLRPVKKPLSQLSPSDELSSREALQQYKKVLLEIGDHITSCLLEFTREEEVVKWREHLWVFVSKFTPVSGQRLFKLYRKVQKEVGRATTMPARRHHCNEAGAVHDQTPHGHHNDRNHHGNKTGHHTNMASSPPH